MNPCHFFQNSNSPLTSVTNSAMPGMSPPNSLDIIRATSRRLPSAKQNARAARVEHLIQSQAWTDAALALIDLELPQWQVRRLAYDDGEWYCALSRQRELPDWLDQSIETRHADLALAILSAFVEAQRISSHADPDQRSGRAAARKFLYEPVCSDNFRVSRQIHVAIAASRKLAVEASAVAAPTSIRA
jgi:hypothetical protein